MLFLVMVFIYLVDEIEFMLIQLPVSFSDKCFLFTPQFWWASRSQAALCPSLMATRIVSP